jgi:hypothetical protein
MGSRILPCLPRPTEARLPGPSEKTFDGSIQAPSRQMDEEFLQSGRAQDLSSAPDRLDLFREGFPAQVLRITQGDQTPLIQDADLMAKFFGFLHEMGGQEDRPLLSTELLDQGADPTGRMGIQPRGRFVQE